MTTVDFAAVELALSSLIYRGAADPAATAQLLDRAVDLIDVRGWCQGAYVGAHGRLCLGGALLTAAGVPFRHCGCGLRHPDTRPAHGRHADKHNARVQAAISAWRQVQRQLMLHDRYLGGVVGFNDTPGRTHGEVTDLLRRTAKRLREQQTGAPA